MDVDGATPLHLAMETLRADVSNALLSSGANVNAIDNFGITPLYLLLSLAVRKNVTSEVFKCL